ncbi:MAG: bacteriocin [Bacilli bacterium]|nr:bacteriocin [Bacilli bacterium]
MKYLSNEQLQLITGGSISASMLGYIVRGINSLLDLGRSIGSAIRRVQNGALCPL